MLAICDVNEYRKCVKEFGIPVVSQLFNTLHHLCNLLVVVPENLTQACTEEQLVRGKGGRGREREGRRGGGNDRGGRRERDGWEWGRGMGLREGETGEKEVEEREVEEREVKIIKINILYDLWTWVFDNEVLMICVSISEWIG